MTLQPLKYYRDYRLKHKEAILKREKRWRDRIRLEVISFYSNGLNQCRKCGYNLDIRALTIDHINNDGNIFRKNRSAADIYQYLRSKKFPLGYQVLCFNCNWLKHMDSL